MSCLFLVVHRAVDVAISKPVLDMNAMNIEEIDAYVLLDEFVYGRENILMSLYVFQGVWSVLFDPILCQSYTLAVRSFNTYHGRESSASTGKLAALLLPLLLPELKVISSLEMGASTSISSSMSDMVGEALVDEMGGSL